MIDARWKRAWNAWGWVAAALGACLGTFLLHVRAWQVGYDASALGLLGCHLIRLPLLLLAWLAVSATFQAAGNKGEPPAQRRFSVLDFAGSFLIFVGCFGCYPVWPFVLVLLAVPLVLAIMLFRNEADPAVARRVRRALFCSGVTVVLFTLTWFLSAATTRQALHGLGQRLEEQGGTDKLLAWAQEMIAESKAKKQPPRIESDDLPDWVKDLLGRFEGVRSVAVLERGDEECVALYTGGSAYHFRIDVCPAQEERRGPPWWAGDGHGLAWRPGIYLDVEGK